MVLPKANAGADVAAQVYSWPQFVSTDDEIELKDIAAEYFSQFDSAEKLIADGMQRVSSVKNSTEELRCSACGREARGWRAEADQGRLHVRRSTQDDHDGEACEGKLFREWHFVRSRDSECLVDPNSRRS